MKNTDALYVVGSILLIIGALTALTGALWSAYIYLTGALAYTLYYLFVQHKGLTVRKRRLIRMNLLGGILFVVSAIFRVRDAGSMWILFFALAMIFTLYANIAQLIADGKGKPKQ